MKVNDSVKLSDGYFPNGESRPWINGTIKEIRGKYAIVQIKNSTIVAPLYAIDTKT